LIQITGSNSQYDGNYIGTSGSGYFQEGTPYSSKSSALTFKIDSNGYLSTTNGLIANQDSVTQIGQPLFLNPESVIGTSGYARALCQVSSSSTLSCNSGNGRNVLQVCRPGATNYSVSNPYWVLDTTLRSGCYAATFNVVTP